MRLRSIITAFTLFVGLTCTAYAGSSRTPLWLAKVSSFYADTSNPNVKTRVTGTGTLLSYGGRWFVLTASHVSQGAQTTIWLGNRQVPFSRRGSDAFSDLEFFELSFPADWDQPMLPLAEWNPTARVFEVEYSQLRKDSTDNLPSPFIPVAQESWTFAPLWVSEKPVGLPAAVNDPTQSPIYSSIGTQVGLPWTTAGLEREANVLITPGMSGAPLITMTDGLSDEHMSSGSFFLQGIALRALRDFDRSYFASSERIALLFEKFILDNYTLKNPQPEWRIQNDNTYRVFSDGTSEIYNVSIRMGNGTSRDGGNGTSRDAGDNREAGEQDPWSQLNIQPGITWKGSQILGATTKCTGNTFFWADFSVLAFADLHSPDCEISQTLKSEAMSLDILAKKLALPSDWSAFVMTSADTDPMGVLLLVTPVRMKLLIQNKANGDQIEADLDSNAVLLGSHNSFFVPIVHVQASNSKREYAIDLRSLFFADLSSIAVEQAISADPMNRGPFTEISDQTIGEKGREVWIRIRDEGERADKKVHLHLLGGHR